VVSDWLLIVYFVVVVVWRTVVPVPVQINVSLHCVSSLPKICALRCAFGSVSSTDAAVGGGVRSKIINRASKWPAKRSTVVPYCTVRYVTVRLDPNVRVYLTVRTLRTVGFSALVVVVEYRSV